jgi:tripartite-type tricarboxylate transporter receptor subunit TctC
VNIRHLVLAGLAAVQLAVAPAALAQAFPNKQVRIVTSFSAGSGPDAMLRIVSQQLGKLWNQSVVVDNRPGGSGFIAIGEARKATPDGYTLLHTDGLNFTAVPHMYAKLPYNAETDVDPISPIHGSHFFVAVSADAPWKNVGELLKAAKDQPGTVTYGSWQIGSVAHLFGAQLESVSGTRMTHVPFRDNAMLYGSVARRDVSWAFGSAASAGALEKGGKLKFLAIAGPTRAATHPHVPTMAESGGPAGFEAAGWVGLFAIKGTPPAVTQQVAAHLARVMAEPEIKTKMVELGYNPMAMKPQDTRALIASQSRDYKAVVTGAAIKLD